MLKKMGRIVGYFVYEVFVLCFAISWYYRYVETHENLYIVLIVMASISFLDKLLTLLLYSKVSGVYNSLAYIVVEVDISYLLYIEAKETFNTQEMEILSRKTLGKINYALGLIKIMTLYGTIVFTPKQLSWCFETEAFLKWYENAIQ